MRYNLLRDSISHRPISIKYPFLVILLVVMEAVTAATGNSDWSPTFVHPTVTGPVVDGISLEIPDEPGNRRLAELGLVDVTAAPFSADATGKNDATAAIQAAVDFARDHQMVTYFPAGTYMITDTISCIQNYYKRSNGKINHARNYPCILFGSRTGTRPTIFLKSGAKGFGSRSKPKPVIHFWARRFDKPEKPAPPVSMNQMFVNLNIEIGGNNPGAVAIHHQGAQGSGIQESLIKVGDGITGIEGGCGSGGSFVDVTIIGGRYGLDLHQTQPSPSITGITLIGQIEAAIVYQGRQALSAAGIRIDSPGNSVPIVGKAAGWAPFHGQMNFIDSRISLSAPGPAFTSESSIYLKNVYLRNASRIISGHDDPLPPPTRDGWIRVEEYANPVQPGKWRDWRYSMNVYEEGRKRNDPLRILHRAAPPENLQSRHLWAAGFPGWETAGAANVRSTPYHAKGDGRADDTIALQRAIDENRTVFLPKGYYNISAPLKLRPDTQLIGIARHLSVITSRSGCRTISSPFAAAPLIQTSDAPGGSATIAFLGLHTPYSVPDTYSLNLRGNTIVRDVNFDTLPPFSGFGKARKGMKKKRTHSLLYVSSGGEGKIYNFFQDDGFPFAFEEPYSHLEVRNTSGPLSFYQCNAERSAGACNIRVENSANISFHGLKGEGNRPVMLVNNSRNIQIFGYGGNGAAHKGEALFYIQNSPDSMFVNLIDSPRPAGEGSPDLQHGEGTDPDQWHMIEVRSGNRTFTSPVLERPLLIRTGHATSGDPS
ncbi:MAG: glycoside hydrolase family 55 protein [Proteobacteria bacterium]|nr:glycoside hydrolase family 55 protein [Pseudomonadota bacterium]MBU1736839.1 glycoside hydrolase family 55 protein [Pseudomonadota bacterium]